MSNIITKASHQWASRPNDERFLSLTDMSAHFSALRNNSRSIVASTTKIHVRPTEDDNLELVGSADVGYEPNNWSFGQLCTLARGPQSVSAPAGYLRTLPAPMAADCLNYGLQYRDIDEVGLLLHRNGGNHLRAATGPRYGRIWNNDVLNALVTRFGDGVTGQWKVPGEFGKPVTVTKGNTTLYASDRDFFIFLCDEENRIEHAGRQLARGFFMWNSEVGAQTFGLGTFMFDFVCKNRMIWGAAGYAEIKFRHTVSAPDKFLSDVTPALQSYAQSETTSIREAIDAARKDRLNDVREFLATRYGPRTGYTISQIHLMEENRPIETRWDVVVGATAYARSIPHQDARVKFEAETGKLLDNKRSTKDTQLALVS